MAKSTIALDRIRRDGGTQTRVQVDAERVTEYAERMKAGDAFPAPVVFHDGEAYWLADGFHRIEACAANGRARIECDVRKGDAFDAFVFGLSANAKHDKSGLYRSNADKRHAVAQLFSWLRKRGEDWSDRKIAEACSVSNQFVANVRPQVSTVDSSTRRVGADGKARKAPTKPQAPPKTSGRVMDALKVRGTVTLKDVNAIVHLPTDVQTQLVEAVESGRAKTLVEAGRAAGHIETPKSDPVDPPVDPLLEDRRHGAAKNKQAVDPVDPVDEMRPASPESTPPRIRVAEQVKAAPTKDRVESICDAFVVALANELRSSPAPSVAAKASLRRVVEALQAMIDAGDAGDAGDEIAEREATS